MALYELEKWRMRKFGLLGYSKLEYLFKNVNSLSIIVANQKLCLPKVGLSFLDSSNFTPTFDMFSRTICLGGGFQMDYPKMYI